MTILFAVAVALAGGVAADGAAEYPVHLWRCNTLSCRDLEIPFGASGPAGCFEIPPDTCFPTEPAAYRYQAVFEEDYAYSDVGPVVLFSQYFDVSYYYEPSPAPYNYYFNYNYNYYYSDRSQALPSDDAAGDDSTSDDTRRGTPGTSPECIPGFEDGTDAWPCAGAGRSTYCIDIYAPGSRIPDAHLVECRVDDTAPPGDGSASVMGETTVAWEEPMDDVRVTVMRRAMRVRTAREWGPWLDLSAYETPLTNHGARDLVEYESRFSDWDTVWIPKGADHEFAVSFGNGAGFGPWRVTASSGGSRRLAVL